MSVHESVLCLQFLTGILAGDSTLTSLAPGGVWRGFAPAGTADPFVVIAFQSAIDALTITGVRPMSHLLYQAKAVGPAGMTAAIANAAAQIDALLGGKDGLRNQSITGGFIGSCYRDGIILTDNEVAGQNWTAIGGLYRIDIEQTT